MRRPPAALAVLILASACATSAPPAASTPAVASQPAAQECPEADLTGPSGSPLDLTGAWRANDYGLYELNQVGACLYWLGMSQYPGTERGAFWTNVFYGTIRNDFTIDGHWGDVPYTADADMSNGEITLSIEFDTSGEEFPLLNTILRTGGFGATAFVPVTALGEATDLEGSFGGNFDHLLQTGCLWVESGGLRYELIGDGGWSIRGDPPIRVEDSRGRVVAREGDPIRVNGFVSPALGGGCVESAILLEALEPIPTED